MFRVHLSKNLPSKEGSALNTGGGYLCPLAVLMESKDNRVLGRCDAELIRIIGACRLDRGDGTD